MMKDRKGRKKRKERQEEGKEEREPPQRERSGMREKTAGITAQQNTTHQLLTPSLTGTYT